MRQGVDPIRPDLRFGAQCGNFQTVELAEIDNRINSRAPAVATCRRFCCEHRRSCRFDRRVGEAGQPSVRFDNGN